MPGGRSHSSDHEHAGQRGRAGLNRDYLVTQALELVDAEGLDALSMRRLAARIGVDPMAAYRHLPNKEALLDGVVEAVVSGIDLSVPDGPWDERLRQAHLRLWQGLLVHPQALPLLARRTWVTGSSLAVVEQGVGLLREAGVPPTEAVIMANSSTLFLISLAIAATAASDTAQRDRGLLAALDPQRYPHLATSLAEADAVGYEEMRVWWCERLISRIAHLRHAE